jgi:hypothetical protein
MLQAEGVSAWHFDQFGHGDDATGTAAELYRLGLQADRDGLLRLLKTLDQLARTDSLVPSQVWNEVRCFREYVARWARLDPAADEGDSWDDLVARCHATRASIQMLALHGDARGIEAVLSPLWDRARHAGDLGNLPPAKPPSGADLDVIDQALEQLLDWAKAQKGGPSPASHGEETGTPRNQDGLGESDPVEPRPKRGRKRCFDWKKDGEVVEGWELAKIAGVPKKDHARDLKLSVKQLNRILNRHAKRKQRARK